MYFPFSSPKVSLPQAARSQTCFEHLALCTNVLRCPLHVWRLTHAPKSDLVGNLSVKQVFIRRFPFVRAVRVLQKRTSYDKLCGTCGQGFVSNPMGAGHGALSLGLAALRRGGKATKNQSSRRKYCAFSSLGYVDASSFPNAFSSAVLRCARGTGCG